MDAYGPCILHTHTTLILTQLLPKKRKTRPGSICIYNYVKEHALSFLINSLFNHKTEVSWSLAVSYSYTPFLRKKITLFFFKYHTTAPIVTKHTWVLHALWWQVDAIHQYSDDPPTEARQDFMRSGKCSWKSFGRQPLEKTSFPGTTKQPTNQTPAKLFICALFRIKSWVRKAAVIVARKLWRWKLTMPMILWIIRCFYSTKSVNMYFKHI